MAVDRDGNVIVAADLGAGPNEIRLLKLSPYGELIWARTIDGPGDEGLYSVVVDAQGTIFVSGDALNSSLTGDVGSTGFSIWAASFSPAGQQQWLKQWQDAAFEASGYIALGPNRTLYLLGTTSAAAAFVGGTLREYFCSEAETAAGDDGHDCGDLIVRQLNAGSGVVLSTKVDKRAGWQIARGLTVDNGGNLYTTATTCVDTETQNTGQSDQPGFDDFNNRYRETKGLSSTAHAGVALAMWDSSGGILWRKTIKNERRSTADGGFLYSEEASGRIVLNDTGLWAMIGTTGEFPGTTAGGDWDAALFSINPQTGDPNLIRLYASAGSDELFLFGPTPGGGLLVTGETTGSLFGPNLGAYDVVAAALAADGTPRWTEQFGGPGTDKGAAVAAGSDGSIYLTGFTDGLMPATLSGLPAGTPLNTHAGGRDFFITKMGAAEGTIQVAHPHF